MTIPVFDPEGAARQLGTEGVNNLVENAERFCMYEEKRIELANKADIVSLEGHFKVLAGEDHDLGQRLQMAPPPGNAWRLRRRAIYYWSLTVILTGAGLVFTLLSFEPFRLGWKGWLYSCGIAVLAPFLVERLLDGNGWEKILRAVTGIAAVAVIASLMLFAVIRGNLFAEKMHEENASASVIDDSLSQAVPQNRFYESSVGLLRLALLLLAFAMEVGAGLVLREAWRSVSDDSEDWNRLRKEQREIRKQMCAMVSHMIMLRNEPAVFVARFWRDFYGAMLSNAVRSAMNKLPIIIFIVFACCVARAHAVTHSSIVIAIDLTQSVGISGPDSRTEFQKNVDGTTRVLAEVPGGSHVTVIGITDHSYAEPYILLSAHIPEDAGYFGERLTQARAQVVRAWKERSAHLPHSFRRTDVLGAIQLASDLFAQEPNTRDRTFIIFSDMRQSTAELNLECATVVPPIAVLKSRIGVMPPFRDVDAYVLGVDGAGRSAAYWQSLRRFWISYFLDAGMSVIRYSVLRDLPDRTPAVVNGPMATSATKREDHQ